MKSKLNRTGEVIRAAAIAGSLASLVSITGAPAAVAGCTAATLKGTFGMSANAPAGPTVGLGVFTFDGVSKITGSEEAVATGVVSNSTETGTYTVNASCVATMNFKVYQNGVFVVSSTYQGVIVNVGAIKINAIATAIGSGKVAPVLEVFEKLE